METIYEVKGYHLKNTQSDKVIFVCLIRDTNSQVMNGGEAGIFIRAWGRRGIGLMSKVEQGSFVSMVVKCRRYKEQKISEGYQTVDWLDTQYGIAKTAVMLHPLIRQTWQDKIDYKNAPSMTVHVDKDGFTHVTPSKAKAQVKKPIVHSTAPKVEETTGFDWNEGGASFIEVDE